MKSFELVNVGALENWRDHTGGWSAHNTREGRRVVDHEIETQYLGLTVNALLPGQEDAYWHDHAEDGRRAGGQPLQGAVADGRSRNPSASDAG